MAKIKQKKAIIKKQNTKSGITSLDLKKLSKLTDKITKPILNAAKGKKAKQIPMALLSTLSKCDTKEMDLHDWRHNESDIEEYYNVCVLGDIVILVNKTKPTIHYQFKVEGIEDYTKSKFGIIQGVNFEKESTSTNESVNHPSHYGGDTTYEDIKVIEAWELGFNLGNTAKYISRAGKKDPDKTIEDLKKAKFYLDREISNLEKSNA